jgi:multiple sugar transport system ATP-binding protein
VAQSLTIKAVRKSFGQGAKAVEVLKQVDIDVAPGEFLILVGPSGCGKSTLLNIIAGLEQATEGDVLIDGKSVINLAPAHRDIAMVFQSYALYPTMSVAQNIGFALEMRKMPKAQREARVAEVAKLLQIEALLDRRPAQLSGGQRQRVAMGRALARQPKLFLFDEPLSNLDAKLRVEMRAEIKRLHQLSGITSVYVTHDQIEAMTLGSRIAVMKGGVVQQLGTPHQIYHQPANTYVAGFMGSPSMNLLASKAFNGPSNADTFGIRPEHLMLDAGSPWRGTVSLVEPTGADTFVQIETGQGKVTMRATAEQSEQLALGASIGLAFKPEHAHWFNAQGNRT